MCHTCLYMTKPIWTPGRGFLCPASYSVPAPTFLPSDSYLRSLCLSSLLLFKHSCIVSSQHCKPSDVWQGFSDHFDYLVLGEISCRCSLFRFLLSSAFLSICTSGLFLKCKEPTETFITSGDLLEHSLLTIKVTHMWIWQTHSFGHLISGHKGFGWITSAIFLYVYSAGLKHCRKRQVPCLVRWETRSWMSLYVATLFHGVSTHWVLLYAKPRDCIPGRCSKNNRLAQWNLLAWNNLGPGMSQHRRKCTLTWSRLNTWGLRS